MFRADLSGRVSVLHEFDRFLDGGTPTATLLTASDGTVWGTTSLGGPFEGGTVFRIDGSGVLTTIHAFDGTGGFSPHGRLLQAADGNIYGTTYGIIGTDFGTIFRIDSLGQLTTLHHFSGPDGGYPDAGLTEGTDGMLYGTASGGGESGYGTIYRLDPDGQDFETIHSFTFVDGGTPQTNLIRALQGGFYGTTTYGGSGGSGTVFHIDSSGTLTPLHEFPFEGGEGSFPLTELVETPAGLLLGATQGALQGGLPLHYGTVFSLDPGGTLTPLYVFDTPIPESPLGGLVQTADGTFYGTTATATPKTGGAVFTLDTGGNFSLLRAFDASEGVNLQGSLVHAADGDFYGMASEGGGAGRGTLFKISTAGQLTILHSFDQTESGHPAGGLFDGGDGFLYGAEKGGELLGAVFRLEKTGGLTTLHEFTGSDGALPIAPPVLRSGELFGTASIEGGFFYGTLCRIDSGGVFLDLHDFGGTDGRTPGALIAANDGNLYGVAQFGGAADKGLVFKVDSLNQVSTVHEFTGLDGWSPSTLMQAGDSNLYGTTVNGDAATVFRLELDGTYTLLHKLTAQEGGGLNGTLVLASDGSLYGTATGGGFIGFGMVYRVVPGVPLPTFTSIEPNSGRAAGGTSATLRGEHLSPAAYVGVGGVTASGVLGIDTFTLRFVVPPLPAGSLNDVVVVNPDSTSLNLPELFFADFLDVDSRPPLPRLRRVDLPRADHRGMRQRVLLPRRRRDARADGGVPSEVRARRRLLAARLHRRLHRRPLHARRRVPRLDRATLRRADHRRLHRLAPAVLPRPLRLARRDGRVPPEDRARDRLLAGLLRRRSSPTSPAPRRRSFRSPTGSSSSTPTRSPAAAPPTRSATAPTTPTCAGRWPCS